MSLSKNDENTSVLAQEEAIAELVRAISSGDEESASKALEMLGASQTTEIFSEVGNLTRTLHNNLLNLQNSLLKDSSDMYSTTLSDAPARLEYILKLTTDASHKTIDLIEEQAAIAGEGQKELANLKEKITEAHTQEELSSLIDDYVQGEYGRLEKIKGSGLEIVMAQEFQDLTGQTIKKVIKLLGEIEGSLLSLLQLLGDKVKKSGTYVVNAKINSEEKVATSAGMDQDDTDELLKELGF